MIDKQHMWTHAEASKYLNEIRPILTKYGWVGTIVGSVAEQGYSDNDLDIDLEPIPNRRHQVHGLAKALKAELMLDYPRTMEVITNNKIVDFIIEE